MTVEEARSADRPFFCLPHDGTFGLKPVDDAPCQDENCGHDRAAHSADGACSLKNCLCGGWDPVLDSSTLTVEKDRFGRVTNFEGKAELEQIEAVKYAEFIESKTEAQIAAEEAAMAELVKEVLGGKR